MDAKNIDDILVQSMNDQQIPETPSTPVEKTVESVQPQDHIGTETLDNPVDAPKQQNDETIETQDETPAEIKSESPIDEYGNPVEKPKMYSEEEVQRMIRDRLSRGRHVESQSTQQQIQKEAEGFQADPNSEEPWDVQLETFIERTLDKREKKAETKKWQEIENQRQFEFESKFTSGMNKYSDFHQVVAGKPITDSILIASRSLDNPAAFIYGAAKMHPQELDRIARINDPISQAAEIGRLHERMVKERKVASSSPRPLEAPRADLPHKTGAQQVSIDERINAYGRQKRK